jgi:hypothetical protein
MTCRASALALWNQSKTHAKKRDDQAVSMTGCLKLRQPPSAQSGDMNPGQRRCVSGHALPGPAVMKIISRALRCKRQVDQEAGGVCVAEAAGMILESGGAGVG